MILRLLSAERPASLWILKHILDKNVCKEKQRKFLKLAGTLLAFEASEFIRWKTRRIKFSKNISIKALDIDRYPLIIISGGSEAIAEGALDLFYNSSVIPIDDINNCRNLLNEADTTKLIIDKHFPSEDKLLFLLEKLKDNNFKNVIILSILVNYEVLKKLSKNIEDLIIITFLIK